MTKFVYKILVEVQFTADELTVLKKMSDEHYDHHCRSVSVVGGFLYGIMNQQQWAVDSHAETLPTHNMKFRDIDTLCKILEGSPRLPHKQRMVADALADKLHNLLTDINAESERMNPRTPEDS